MVPMRYIGPLHAFGLMFREEGIRGLYRGYAAYLIATSMYTTLVPMIAEFSIMNKPISGNFDDDINRLYDEVISQK